MSFLLAVLPEMLVSRCLALDVNLGLVYRLDISTMFVTCDAGAVASFTDSVIRTLSPFLFNSFL